MKLIITRHGQTEENKKGILAGSLDGKLTEKGIRQAKKLALRLKDEKIDYIFSSDLARASDTAKEIIKFHSDVPVEFTRELRERDLGVFEGKTKTELHCDPTKFDSKAFRNPKNGESYEKYFGRIKSFLSGLLNEHSKDTYLLVAHSGINTLLVSILLGKEWCDMGRMDNTSISVFEIGENKACKTHSYNCTSHLY